MKVVLLLLFILCLRNVSCERRIVGGSSAKDGWFPYAAFLMSGGTTCTGSLLTSSWVLTAAHCVHHRRSVVRVMAGAAARNSRFGQWRHSRDVKIHPNYIRGRVGATDLALVKVSSPFNMRSRNIGVIRLSNQWWPRNKYVRCIALGWGQTANYPPAYPNVLQYNYAWVSQGSKPCPCLNRNIQSKVVCLSPVRGSGPCWGDSGGPLVCGGKAVGVAHWLYYKDWCNKYEPRTRGCGTTNTIFSYMFLTPELRWIRRYVPGVAGPSTYFSAGSICHLNLLLVAFTVIMLLF